MTDVSFNILEDVGGKKMQLNDSASRKKWMGWQWGWGLCSHSIIMRIYPCAINPVTVHARVKYILGCLGELFVGCTAV